MARNQGSVQDFIYHYVTIRAHETCSQFLNDIFKTDYPFVYCVVLASFEQVECSPGCHYLK